jgi:hypothetical protein
MICFTSVSFGDAYNEQQVRLKESILKIYPDANINFYYNRIPNSSRTFFESLYGFKPHAIHETRSMGFDQVVWLDPAMILERELDDSIFQYPVIAVKDDHKLDSLISQQCLDYYSLTRNQLFERDWRLVGGSFYYFDFNQQSARDTFSLWHKAEVDGLFGSQVEAASEQITGHRNDETCMAVAMYLNGIEPQSGFDVKYCIGENAIFTKKHFK